MARNKKQAQDIPHAADAPLIQSNQRPPRSKRPCPHAAAITLRQMTPEEERQLEAVLDLFLAEFVREQFERQQISC